MPGHGGCRLKLFKHCSNNWYPCRGKNAPSIVKERPEVENKRFISITYLDKESAFVFNS
jgi:hypothetical protein